MILINPSSSREKKLGGFARYVPLTVPIGIGYLAAYLTKNSNSVRIIDEEIEPVSDAILDKYVEGLKKPYIFGLSCLTAGIGRAHQLAGMIKAKYPDSKIIFGNIHPTVLYKEVLEDANVDIVVRGEGEETLNSLYERIKNKSRYDDVRGISFRTGNTVVNNEDSQLPSLDNIPKFPYRLFKQYSEKYALGFIASSRGCPYNCIFCSQRSISGRKYRFFPSKDVIESIGELIEQHNQSFITFVDDSFLMNKNRILELCDAIQARGFHKKAIFDCQARSDTVDEHILKILRDSGFRTIHFGIETASDRLMKMIDKCETVEEIKDSVKLAKKVGFQVSGTFILGLPTETRQERSASYKLAKELELDYVRFNNATPYPGTKLYEIAKNEDRLNPGKQWENLNACGTLVESPFKNNPLAYVPLTTSEKELRHDILKYNLFYSFRPQSVYKILKERVGPAGWLSLPKRWYFKFGEWCYLIGFGFKILCLFANIFIYDIANFFRIRKT